LARTVAACAEADAIMAGEEPRPLAPLPLEGLRIGIAQGLPLRGLDQAVTARLFDAINALGHANVALTAELFPIFDEMARLNSKGAIAGIEAFAIHRDRLAAHGADFDPFVRARLEQAGKTLAADYVNLLHERLALVRAMDARLGDLDAIVMPANAIVAPTIAECRDPATALARNTLLLRNAQIVNFFDLCAISLPLPRNDGLPVGLMLVARNGQDRRLLRIAAAVEHMLAEPPDQQAAPPDSP
jgi:aspartyl-tRNA(Asn)/glutamyl-tRNA(Gln) amidotransferase subunit A